MAQETGERPAAERIPRVTQAQLEEIVDNLEVEPGAMDIACVTDCVPGEILPGGKYPSGKGGETYFGVAWVSGGRTMGEPFALFENVRDANALYRMIESAHLPWSEPARGEDVDNAGPGLGPEGDDDADARGGEGDPDGGDEAEEDD